MSFLRRILAALLFIAVVILTVAPTAASGRDPETSSADVLLIVDRTTSMSAQDYHGHEMRLDGVKADIHTLLDQLPSARFAVIAIDNRAQLLLPWTNDVNAVATLASTIDWRSDSQASGTDIGIGVDEAIEVLGTSHAKHPRAARYVVYLGDGEQTASTPPTSFEPLRTLINGALVLGYGTEAGATMFAEPGSNRALTRGNDTPLSHADPAALQTIAEQLGGTYEHRDAPGKLPVWQVKNPTLEPDDPSRLPLVWWLGIMAAALLVWEIAVTAHASAKVVKQCKK